MMHGNITADAISIKGGTNAAMKPWQFQKSGEKSLPILLLIWIGNTNRIWFKIKPDIIPVIWINVNPYLVLTYYFYYHYHMTVNISVSLQPKMLRRLDELRGDVPKSKFIQRLIEDAKEK
jgi:hypothetical protein